MLLIMLFVAVFYLAWIATTLVVAVDLAKRFSVRTIYLALILLCLGLGFTWGINYCWSLQFFGLSLLILPPVRLLLHFFAKDKGYELRGGFYKFCLFGVTICLCGSLLLYALISALTLFRGSW